MQQGETVALYNYMAQMIVELIKLASLIITLNKAAACAGRVADILNVRSSMNYVAETETQTDSDCAVAFQDVTFPMPEPRLPVFPILVSQPEKDRQWVLSAAPEAEKQPL